jgi:hypothetical protein
VAEGEPLDLELLLAPETRGAEEALDG